MVARNAQARYGLRILQLLETQGDFTVYPAEIGTHQNVPMDYTTRAKLDAVKEEMARQGLQEISLVEPWHQLFQQLEEGQPLGRPL